MSSFRRAFNKNGLLLNSIQKTHNYPKIFFILEGINYHLDPIFQRYNLVEILFKSYISVVEIKFNFYLEMLIDSLLNSNQQISRLNTKKQKKK